MAVHLLPLDARGPDRRALREFLTTNAFPFHATAHPTPDEVDRAIDTGAYGDAATAAFWVAHVDHGVVGVLRMQDLTDPTPMFDLRLAERWRGRDTRRTSVWRCDPVPRCVFHQGTPV